MKTTLVDIYGDFLSNFTVYDSDTPVGYYTGDITYHKGKMYVAKSSIAAGEVFFGDSELADKGWALLPTGAERVDSIGDVTLYDSDSEGPESYVLSHRKALAWDSDLQKWRPYKFGSKLSELDDFEDSEIQHFQVIVWDSDQQTYRGASSGSTTFKTESFIATPSQTDFTLANAPIGGNISFARNGATLLTNAYEVSGSTVTYKPNMVGDSENLEDSDEIVISYMTGDASSVMFDSIFSMKDVKVTAGTIQDKQVLAWDSEQQKFINKSVNDVRSNALSFPGTGGMYGSAYTIGDKLYLAGSASTDRIMSAFDPSFTEVAPHIEFPGASGGWSLDDGLTNYKVHLSNMYAINPTIKRLCVMGEGTYAATGTTNDAWTGSALTLAYLVPGGNASTYEIKDYWITDFRGMTNDAVGKCSVLVKLYIPETGKFEYVTFGYNLYGLTGQGSTAGSRIVAYVSHLSGRDVADAFISHSNMFVRCQDGTMWASGFNNTGQLGNGNTSNSSVFVQMSTGAGAPITNAIDFAVSVSITSSSVWVVASDGTAYACGDNSDGRLSVGTTSTTSYLTPVLHYDGTPASNFRSVEAGTGMSVFIDADSKAWAGGVNTEYQARTDFNWAVNTSPSNKLYQYSFNNMREVKFMGAPRDFPLWFWLDNTGAIFVSGKGVDATQDFMRGNIRWRDNTSTIVAKQTGLGGLSSDEYPEEWFKCGHVNGTGVSYQGIMIKTNKNRIWAWGQTDSTALAINTTQPHFPVPVVIKDLNA